MVEKQNLIKKNSQTGQVKRVDQHQVKVKFYEKRQLKLKYHLLGRKYHNLKNKFQSKCCILKKALY